MVNITTGLHKIMFSYDEGRKCELSDVSIPSQTPGTGDLYKYKQVIYTSDLNI